MKRFWQQTREEQEAGIAHAAALVLREQRDGQQMRADALGITRDEYLARCRASAFVARMMGRHDYAQRGWEPVTMDEQRNERMAGRCS